MQILNSSPALVARRTVACGHGWIAETDRTQGFPSKLRQYRFVFMVVLGMDNGNEFE